MDVNARKGVKEQDLGLILIKFLFIAVVQKFNSIQRFLEAGEKGLRRHDLGFLFSTMHVVKETVTSSNKASGRSHVVQKGATDLLGGIGFVNSIMIFNIGCL